MIEQRNYHISALEARLYEFVSRSPQWLTNSELAERTGITPRTIRSYTKKWHSLGLLEVNGSVFPGNRFRWAPSAQSESYRRQLEVACECHGVGLESTHA